MCNKWINLQSVIDAHFYVQIKPVTGQAKMFEYNIKVVNASGVISYSQRQRQRSYLPGEQGFQPPVLSSPEAVSG